MLMVVMILMVGVTSAQVPLKTMTPTKLEQTLSTQQTMSSTSTTSPTKLEQTLSTQQTMSSTSTTSAETSRTVQQETSTIPTDSSVQPQATPENPATISTNRMITFPVARNALPSTTAVMEDTVRRSTLQLETAVKTAELPTIPFFQSIDITEIIPTKTYPCYVNHVSYQVPTKSTHQTKPYLLSSTPVSTESIPPTKLYPLSNYHLPIENAHPTKPYPLPSYETSNSIQLTKQYPLVDYRTPTSSFTENSTSRKEIGGDPQTTSPGYRNSETSAKSFLTTPSLTNRELVFSRRLAVPEGPRSLEFNTTTSTPHRQTTRPIEREAKKIAVTSPASPIPNAPLPSEVRNPTEVPPNTVESMQNLPWIKHGSTSVFSKEELDNVLHPTLASIISRNPSKALKIGHPRDSKRATTTSILSSLKDNEQNLDHQKYISSDTGQAVTSSPFKITLPVSPDLDVLTSRSELPTTSFPFVSTSGSIPRPPPVLHQRASGNQPWLRTALSPIKSTSAGNPKSPVIPTSRINGNQSSSYPLRSASAGNPKTFVTPTSRISGNQSTSFPVASALKLKLKVPVIVSPFSVKTNTSPPEILPTLDNANGNTTENCTNDYCVSDEEYIDMMLEYMFPTSYEWVLIGMHIIVFVGGLIGNALVCVAVYRNHTMRTVTNYFIVNLAVADFLVIFLCLPPSVLWDVTETWFMGTALCKIVLYFQTVSVAVSILTLTFISVDRWYAICFPLKFKSTTGRAKTAIVVIWVMGLAFDIPELVVLQTKRKDLSIDTMFFTQCEPSWSDKTDMAFHCMQIVLLYTLPLVFMSIAYFQIVRVLWSSNIPGYKERLDSSGRNGEPRSCRSDTIQRSKKISRCTSVTISTTGQVICRRKAAKMLVAVVIMFAVCYFPVHLLSILRYTLDLPQTDGTTAFAMVSHWLCYANSAVNPLIYNFMSGKFRKEFAHAFGCRRITWKRAAAFARRRRQPGAPSGVYRGNVPRGPQRAEMVPLSGDAGVTNIVIDIELPC